MDLLHFLGTKRIFKHTLAALLLGIAVPAQAVTLNWPNGALTDSTWKVIAQLEPGESYRRIEISIAWGFNGDDSESYFFDFKQGKAVGNVYFRKGPIQYRVGATGDEGLRQVGIKYGNIQNADTRENIAYLLPSQMVQSDSQFIIDLAKQTVGFERQSGAHTNSARENSQMIHDYVASHVAYDVESWLSGSTHLFDALETAQSNLAVCSGYANLNAAMHRAIGIPARVIIGPAWSLKDLDSKNEVNAGTDKKGSLHAWNEILIDGKWIIEDTTWDAGFVNKEARTFRRSFSRNYFDPDPVFFEKTHAKQKIADY